MATQQTNTSPNTSKLGIFPDLMRKFVIVVMVILFVIAGIIGIQQAWGNLSNILAVIFGVVGVILGFLTFWSSKESKEISTEVSATPSQTPPVQVNIYNNPGQQVSAQVTSELTINNANNNQTTDQNTVTHTDAASSQQPPKNAHGDDTNTSHRDELPQFDKDNLYDALTTCLPAVFTKVVRYSHVPRDILSGDEKAQAIRADELIRWAELPGGQGLFKLYDAMYKAGVEVSRQYYEPQASVIEKSGRKGPEYQIEHEQERIAIPHQSAQDAQQQQPVEKNMPQSMQSTDSLSAQQDDLDEDEISHLTQDLIDSPQSVFDNIVATYRPPSGVARTGSIPFRVEELVKTAKLRGDLPKLRNAYYSAIGKQLPEKKFRMN